jgi:heme A synthase
MLNLLFTVVLVVVVVGLLIWALDRVPIDPTLRQWARVVLIVIAALWLIYLVAGAAGVSLR